MDVQMENSDRFLIGIVFGLLLICIYMKLRTKFKIKVNCWFCNKNTKIPYQNDNKWICKNCGQYNGFTKDGDYNINISEYNNSKSFNSIQRGTNYDSLNTSFDNSLCDFCNKQQEMKIRKLASFDVDLDGGFDWRYEEYKKKLDEQYMLCTVCSNNVDRILTEKKKLIFLYKSKLNLKAARAFRKLRKFHKSKNTILKNFCIYSIFLSSLIFCTRYILESQGLYTSFMVNITSQHPFKYLQKLVLYIRTCFWMLFSLIDIRICRNLGSLSSIILSKGIPLLNICFTFSIIVLDKFKLSRYTYLLLVWSLFVVWKSAIDDFIGVENKDFVKLILAVLTILLTFPFKNPFTRNSININNVNNNFHHIPVGRFDDIYDVKKETHSFTFDNSRDSTESSCSSKSNDSSRKSQYSPKILNLDFQRKPPSPVNNADTYDKQYPINSIKLNGTHPALDIQLNSQSINDFNNKLNYLSNGNEWIYSKQKAISLNGCALNPIDVKTYRKNSVSSIYQPFSMLNMAVPHENNRRTGVFISLNTMGTVGTSVFQARTLTKHNLILPSKLN